MKKVIFSLVIIFSLIIDYSMAIGFEAEKIYEAVFVISSGNALGSGFAIGKDCIITNAHVLDNKGDINVVTYSGNYYAGDIVAIDKSLDIAVLKVNGVDFDFLKVADYSKLAIGSDVYALGIPSSMSYTLTKGVLSSKDRKYGGYKYIQTDAAINSGNSGGPLLNDLGEVIGVNTLKLIDSEGIGLSIPMTTVCDFLVKNDIEVDEQGNVVGMLAKEYNSNVEKESLVVSTTEVTRLKVENLILKILLGVSILAIVLLSILLIFNRKKKSDNTIDDFEIEIFK